MVPSRALFASVTVSRPPDTRPPPGTSRSSPHNEPLSRSHVTEKFFEVLPHTAQAFTASPPARHRVARRIRDPCRGAGPDDSEGGARLYQALDTLTSAGQLVSET